MANSAAPEQTKHAGKPPHRPGYRADRVISAEVFTTNFTKYPNVDTQRRFYLPLIERLESQPGIVSVVVTNAVPLRATQPGSVPFQIEGRVDDNPERRPTADARIVSSAFFQCRSKRDSAATTSTIIVAMVKAYG